MTTADARRVAAARRWYREQGYAPTVEGAVTWARTPAHANTYEANWVLAGLDADPAAVLAALDRYWPIGWQVVLADALTSPTVEAALALADFRAEPAVIEMLAADPIVVPQPAAIDLTPVDDASWAVFEQLVEVDHAEGRRTGTDDAAANAGLLDAMRRRRATCDYWLLREEGEAVGYGMTVACPGGLGLIESLFTLPAWRGRGLMSAFIAAADERLRASGCDAVFLDAHAHDTPKRLYARLGFAPVAITRTWVRQREG